MRKKLRERAGRRRREDEGPPRREGNATGFTIVELLVAVVILAFGVLGMAGTTMYVIRQITASDLETKRAAALQSGLEQVRAIPFDSLAGGADTLGDYRVTWTINDQGTQSAEVALVTRGPGVSGSSGGMARISADVVDTFTFTVIRRR